MNIQITIDLPETVFLTLPHNPEEFVQQMRLAAAIKWYELQLISPAQAADIAGISHRDFQEALTHFTASPLPDRPEELLEKDQEKTVASNETASTEYLTAMHAYLARHTQPLLNTSQPYPKREELYDRPVLLR